MIQHQPFSEYAVQFSISCQSFKEIHLKIALKKTFYNSLSLIPPAEVISHILRMARNSEQTENVTNMSG